MKSKPLHKLLALAAAASLLLAAGPAPLMACSPGFPFQVFFNAARPDLPLKNFAAGRLGILQPSYAKSYLVVAYRYLNGSPLSAVEQRSMLRLWQKRLRNLSSNSDYSYKITEDYLSLRKSALGPKAKEKNYYDSSSNLQPDAFRQAYDTLQSLIKSQVSKEQIKNWIAAQDIVFEVAGAETKDATLPKLPPLSSKFSERARHDRLYQEASLMFYGGRFKEAARLYQELAKENNPRYKTLAVYMTARSLANGAFGQDESLSRETATDFIDKQLKQEKDPEMRLALLDLKAPLFYGELSREQLLEATTEKILKPGQERFGAEVGDLTFAMDEMESSGCYGEVEEEKPKEGAATENTDTVTKEMEAAKLEKEKRQWNKYFEGRLALMGKQDLTDWLETVQSRYDPYAFDSLVFQEKKREIHKLKAAHALAQFRKDKSQTWLIGTLLTGGLSGPERIDVKAAAEKLTPTSPAYLTASFFLLDDMIKAGKTAEARLKLSQLLKESNQLSPTTLNLFKAQYLAVAKGESDYLHAAFMQAPEQNENDDYVPADWLKKQNLPAGTYTRESAALDNEVASDLNRNLPLSLWLKLCFDPALDAACRSKLTRVTWMRAHLLGNRTAARKLTEPLCRAYPSLASMIRACDSAPENESRYILAKFALRNFGLSPYLASGVERHGLKINEFDYYNQNFWVPMQAKAPVLTKEEEYSEFFKGENEDRGAVLKSESGYDQMLLQYYKTGISGKLSAAERKQAQEEALALSRLSPSNFLGEAVFDKLKRNAPHDQDLEEMLYRIVKLAKWSPRTELASQYSHKAHNLLHKHFPTGKWTQKAPYWY